MQFSCRYFTLGYIMEKITGKSYSQLMKQDIFDKLQMSNSGSYQHLQIVPNRATGYDYNFRGFTSADFRDQSNTIPETNSLTLILRKICFTRSQY